jgi:dihydrofolate reductase
MISLLVAMDNNRTIGKNNDLPWYLPADLKYFKKVTMGHPIVMGRKTYESIGRPLPGRENIIITRDKSYDIESAQVVHSIQEAIDVTKDEDEVFVIGGAEIFKQYMPDSDRLYITQIEHDFDGDTFFPEINYAEWKIISKEKGIKDEKNPYDYYFMIYDRKEV